MYKFWASNIERSSFLWLFRVSYMLLTQWKSEHDLLFSGFFLSLRKYEIPTNDPNVNSVHCFLRLSLSTNFSLNLLNGDKYNGMHSAINYKWNDSIALTFERAVKCNKRSLDCKSFSSKNPENRVNRFGHLIEWFLAATKQLYKWYFPSVCPSVCLSVPLSVTPFWLCSHHHIIMKFLELLQMTTVRSMQIVKVRDQRSRSQRSQPNLNVSGL